MLLTTTNTIEGFQIKHYLGLVTGDTIIGANIFKDFLASITDIVGGRSASYEKVLKEAKTQAEAELVQTAMAMGANAVIGIDFDYEVLGKGSMLMVSMTGTAVIYNERKVD
ncbi:MAG: YbjQ family protein [Saprospiraceae bacterium]|nr:YbjQ family protein [Saprospiraceae bacterium]